MRNNQQEFEEKKKELFELLLIPVLMIISYAYGFDSGYYTRDAKK